MAQPTAATVGVGWLFLDRLDAASPLWVFGAFLAFIVADRVRQRFFGATELPEAEDTDGPPALPD